MVSLIGFLVFAVVVITALKLIKAKAPVMTVCIQGRPILTDNECEFFHRLQRALPEYHIFPQVAANALLEVAPDVPRQRYHAVRNRFAQKHVDFVICERETLAVKAIVELDDKTHVAEKDSARDELLGRGGYRVLRFQSRKKPSEAEIAAFFIEGRCDVAKRVGE